MSVGAADPARLGRKTAWTALILITLTQAMSMVDRQIIAILAPRIKADLHISDAELGLLYGTVFALFYALFSLPLGRLADGWIRTRLLAISIAGWSAMTALAGFANNFTTLAAVRLGVGIGEASVQPAGMSMISDLFPKRQRAMATSLIAAGVALGLGAALWLGGAVADGWDAAFANGAAPLKLKGWQAAFLAAAIPGLVLAVFLARLPEPARGAADGVTAAPDPHPWRASWRTLSAILPVFAWINLARRRAPARDWIVNIGGLMLIIASAISLARATEALSGARAPALILGGLAIGGNALQWGITGFGAYVMLCWAQSLRLSDNPAHAIILKSPSLIAAFVIAALQSVINYGGMAWNSFHLVQTFDLALADVGLRLGFLVAFIGMIGPLIAGPLADWLHARFKAGRLYVTLAALTLSPILGVLTYRAETEAAFYLLFVPFSLSLTMWLPPIYATFLDLSLPRMRGSVFSFYILTMTIIGLGLGPYAVGLLSDASGGTIGEAINSLFWLSPLIAILVIFLIVQAPRDEATLIARARAAGEVI